MTVFRIKMPEHTRQTTFAISHYGDERDEQASPVETRGSTHAKSRMPRYTVLPTNRTSATVQDTHEPRLPLDKAPTY